MSILALLAALALVQEPSNPPSAPQEQAAAAEAPRDPALQSLIDAAPTEADLDAAGEALEPLFETVEAEAGVIRADASLSEQEKAARIAALVESHRAEFEAFGDLLAGFVTGEAARDGAPLAEAQAAGARMKDMIMSSLLAALTAPEGDQEDEAEEPADEPAGSDAG